MRKGLCRAALLLLILPGVIACKPEQKADVPATAEEVTAPAADAVPDAHRFSVAGIDDPAVVVRALERLQTALRAGDRAGLAGMVRYPFTTYANGQAVRTYDGTAALLQDFDRLFSPPVQSAILRASDANVFVNGEGIMLGNGELWLNIFEGQLLISAINPPPAP